MSLYGKYCVYKYVYNNEIVYIGESSNLDDRVRQHSEETRFFGLDEIYYFICDSKKAMDVNELYYINLYNPPLNRLKNPNDEKNNHLIIKKPEWIQYNRTYPCPLPYLKEFKENLLNKQFDYSGKMGTYVLPEHIKYFNYGGLDLVTLNDVHKYQLMLRDYFDDEVGKQTEKIFKDMCYKRKIKHISYLGNNTWHIEEE